METKDKRVKREIANSNERRRMQSINAGFQKLKRLLPVGDGDKLSKAAILQHASEFIQQIERDKRKLFEQNTLMRGILMDLKSGTTDISMALKTIDLDALPTIPINTHIATTIVANNKGTVVMATTNKLDSGSQPSQQQQQKCANTTTSNDKNSSSNVNNNNNNSYTTISSSNSTTTTTTKTVNNNISKESNIKNNAHNQDINSDRVPSPKNGLVPAGVAKAAIALPLEVPYTSETAIRVDQRSSSDKSQKPRKILKTEPTTLDPQDPASKGQTLDTICKAIMEIEGDRVFNHHEGT